MPPKIRIWVCLTPRCIDDQQNTDYHGGLSLREMIHEFKYQTLVLFKGLLLQPKVGDPLYRSSTILSAHYRRCFFSEPDANVYA